jgi:preprotein translocase subunit SecE
MPEAVKVRNEAERESSGPAVAVAGAANKVTEKWQQLRQFLHEVRVEMRHVTWPTRSDIESTTVVVIITIFFFGLFLFLVDQGMARLIQPLFKLTR